MPYTQPIRVLVVDSRALIRRGIGALLEGCTGLRVVEEARNTQEAIECIQKQAIDVVTVDIDMPGWAGGVDVIAAIRRAGPYAQIVVLTNVQDRASIRAALKAGALSYLLKNISVEELADAIRAAHQGVPTLSTEVTSTLMLQPAEPAPDAGRLTAREQQVLELMSRGMNNQQIAIHLSISLSTVQFHVSNILNKLGARNRTEATALALRHQLTEGPRWDA